MNQPPLPDGKYPFIDREYALADMIMAEAPSELADLFKSQAKANGIELLRDKPYELRCRMAEFDDAAFFIYWPHGTASIYMLTPKGFVTGRA